MAKDSAPAAAPAGTKATPTKPFGEGAVAVNSILPQDAGKTRAVAGTIQGAFTSSHGTLMKVRDDSGHIDVFLMKAAVKKLPREQRNLLKNGNRIHLNAPVKKFKGRAELRITKTAQIIDVRPAE